MSTSPEYEIGRKARRDGESLQSNPYYWSWFRHCTWERGWFDEDRLSRSGTAKAPTSPPAPAPSHAAVSAAH